MENFGKGVFALLSLVIILVINGFIFEQFWLWFVVSTFKFQPITFIQSIGIVFLIKSFLVPIPKPQSDNNNWDDFLNAMGLFFSRSTFTFVVGYLISLLF
jgi:hypothetical protein